MLKTSAAANDVKALSFGKASCYGLFGASVRQKKHIIKIF